MRTMIASFMLVCAGLLVSTGTNIAGDKEKDKKEVTLKGKVCCNKCELGTGTECATVILVKGKDKEKDVIYYFDKASHGKFHDDICTGAKNGTVVGLVKDVDKKKVISVKKVTYD